MKAKIHTKIDTENRTKLEDVIPLSEPLVISIEPTDICNFKCEFCPNGRTELLKNTNRNLGYMELKLFKKIIDDISKFEKKVKCLKLYGNGEPLLHKDFYKMVEYAKLKNVSEKIKVTTNASFLSNENSLNIIKAGLDRIEISIEGLNEEEYYNFSGIKINFQKLLDNINFFYNNKKQCEVFIKIAVNNPTEEYVNKFYDIFGNMADIVHIDNISDTWNGYNSSKIEYHQTKTVHDQIINKNKKVCTLIFYTMHISSDGKVVPCFSDYKKRMIFSDINEISVKEAWNSQYLRKMHIMFLSGKKNEHPICKNCKHPIFESYDDIDEYKEELLKRYITN